MAYVDADGGHRQQVHTEVRSPAEAVIARVVYWIFGVIEVLLALRFVLLLFGANRDAGFVAIVLSLSSIFMAPFNAVFPTQSADGAVFEWSALVALIIYALIAWGIVSLINALSPRRSAETVERVEHRDDTFT